MSTAKKKMYPIFYPNIKSSHYILYTVILSASQEDPLVRTPGPLQGFMCAHTQAHQGAIGSHQFTYQHRSRRKPENSKPWAPRSCGAASLHAENSHICISNKLIRKPEPFFGVQPDSLEEVEETPQHHGQHSITQYAEPETFSSQRPGPLEGNQEHHRRWFHPVHYNSCSQTITQAKVRAGALDL